MKRLTRVGILSVTVMACQSIYALQTGGGQPSSRTEKQEGKKSDEGSTCPSHDKYMGQIVFAKEPIKRGEENPSKFTRTFTLGDPIHARGYRKQSMRSELIDYYKGRLPRNTHSCKFYWHIIVNGKSAGGNTRGTGDDEQFEQWTTNGLPLAPKGAPVGERGNFESQLLAEAVKTLAAGTYKVQVDLFLAPDWSGQESWWGPEVKPPADRKVLCSGSFDLVVDPKAREQKTRENRAKLPPSQMKDAELEKAIVTAYHAEFPDANCAVVGLSVLSKDWTPVRHQYTGELLGRRIYVVLVRHLNESGQCVSGEFGFDQGYLGDGVYSKEVKCTCTVASSSHHRVVYDCRDFDHPKK